MIYSTEIENMCQVKKGANHDPAPIQSDGVHLSRDAAN